MSLSPPVPSPEISQEFPPELSIAAGYAPARYKPLWLALFALDQRLAKLVSNTSEPMLAQIKLAWWRDRLNEDVDARPSGDAVLDGLAVWARHEAALISMIDGWEALVCDEVSPANMEEFLTGRAAPFARLASISGSPELSVNTETAAKIWVLSDLVAHMSDEAERTSVQQEFAELSATKLAPLPKAMRPLAVLAALAQRHLKIPKRPILSRRRDALIALRAGMFGK